MISILLQFLAFTQSDIQKKEVKRSKPIHHFITEGTNDLNVPLYCYIMPEFSERMFLKIKQRLWAMSSSSSFLLMVY